MRRTHPWQHAVAIALLLAVCVLRWWPYLVADYPVNDELSYVRGARLAAAGESPYSGGGYLYPPGPAIAGAVAIERFGLVPTLRATRLANYLGLTVVAWIAVGFLPAGPLCRWLAAAAILALSPAVRFGVAFANLSLAVGALLVLGVILWPRHALAAAGLLGASLAIKPLAPGALAVIALHRGAAPARHRLLTVGTAVAVAFTLVLPLPWSGDMLRFAAAGLEPLGRSASLHRIAFLLGWTHWTPLLSLALLLPVAAIARRRDLRQEEILALSLAAAVSLTPVVWSHTLVLTLPLQVMAAVRAWRRRHHHGRVRPSLEITLVALGVAALQLAEGATGIDDRAVAVQVAGVLPPATAPLLLALYLIATAGPRDDALEVECSPPKRPARPSERPDP